MSYQSFFGGLGIDDAKVFAVCLPTDDTHPLGIPKKVAVYAQLSTNDPKLPVFESADKHVCENIRTWARNNRFDDFGDWLSRSDEMKRIGLKPTDLHS